MAESRLQTDGSCFSKAINLVKIGGEFLVQFSSNAIQIPVQVPFK